MIRIDKSKEPAVFSRIKTKRKNYDELVSSEKDELKKCLLEEQGYLCAYCMSKINIDNSTIEHYIPRNGKNGNNTLSLDYRNLFAVCDTTRGLPKALQTCDVKKGDDLLHIDPRERSHIETIQYEHNGKIKSTFDKGFNNFDDDLNSLLNLNSNQLKHNRKNAYITLLKKMNRKKQTTWKNEFINRYIEKLSSSDDKLPYSGFLIFMLKHKLHK